MQIGLCQSLIDARLIRAEGAATLQQQGNALERRALGYDMTLPMRTPVSRHEKRLPQHGARSSTRTAAGGCPSSLPIIRNGRRGRLGRSYIYVPRRPVQDIERDK